MPSLEKRRYYSNRVKTLLLILASVTESNEAINKVFVGLTRVYTDTMILISGLKACSLSLIAHSFVPF